MRKFWLIVALCMAACGHPATAQKAPDVSAEVSSEDAADVADSADGTDGVDGTGGADGKVGVDGSGLDGTDGVDGSGLDGTDGVDGTVGVDGKVGVDGSGLDGTDGVDGSGLDGTDAADGVELDAGTADAQDAEAQGSDVADADAQGSDADGGDAQDAGPPDTSANDADAGSAPPSGPLAPCDAAHPCAQGTCDLTVSACIACLVSADCGADALCQAHACHPAPACKADKDCKASGQVCAKSENVCVDCVVDADCAAGQACNDHACGAVMPCKSSKECPKAAAVCNSEAGVCVACLDSLDCATGEICTSSHACVPAVCQNAACAGAMAFACQPDGSGYLPGVACDDDNPCSADSCGAGACVHLPVAATCTDGNACTPVDACQDGQCKGSGAVACDDGNPCTVDGCDAATGCTSTQASGPCDDGKVCTTGDTCSGGTCQGQAKDCSDGNACTTDGCSQQGACTWQPVASAQACDDGNVCTSGEACAAGQCSGGSAKVCSDGNPCTLDGCDPQGGCTAVPSSGACDDGDGCTTGDACSGGKCQGTAKACDDGNPCTADGCTQGACQATAAANGTACGAGKVCQQGACQALGGGDPCAGGAEGLFSKTYGPQTGALFAAAPVTDGFIAGGVGNGWLLRTDATGGVVWQKFLSKTADDSVSGVEPLAGGHVAVLLRHFANGSMESSQWFDVGPDGAVAASTTFDGGNLGAMGNSLVAAPDGYLVAGEALVAPNVHAGWLQHLGSDGKPGWQATFGGSATDRFQAAAVTPQGYAAVGKILQDGKTFPWLVRVDKAGKTLANVTLGPGWSNGISGFESVRSLPDGGLLLGGIHLVDPNMGYVGYVVRTAADGGILWQRDAVQIGASPSFSVLALQGDGSFLAVSQEGKLSARIGANGDLGELKTFQGFGNVFAGRELQDGTLLLAGNVQPDSQAFGKMGRYDNWLHGTCAAAGKCSAVLTCDDGNGCTADTCNSFLGCQHTALANDSACSDGDACTTGDVCKSGKCEAVKVTNCDDGNGCTTDSCKAGPGCVHTPNTSPCDDGNPCTNGDACAAGACQGKVLDCDDKNPCTADTCNGSACGHTALADDSICGDGLVCKASTCVSGAPANPCTNKELYLAGVGDSTTAIQRVLPIAGGGFLAGGGASQGFLARLSPGGQVTWKTALVGVGAVADLVQLTNGHFGLIVGAPKPGFVTVNQAQWREVDGAGTTLSMTNLTLDSDYDDVQHLVSRSDGKFVAVGSVTAGGVTKGRATLLDPTGKVLWNQMVGGSGGDAFWSGIARPDKTVLLAGRVLSNNLMYGWVVTLDENGTVLSNKTYGIGTNGQTTAFYGAADSGDGGAVLAGQTGGKAWLVRINSAGLIVWERKFFLNADDTSSFRTVRAVPGGDFILAGTDHVYAVLTRYDGSGKMRWYSSYPAAPNSAMGLDVDVLSNGFVFGGLREGMNPRGLVVRTDSWGNGDCQGSGSCATQAQSACQSSNPCQMDWCDAFSSCDPLSAPEGLPCADGKTCKSGACK